MLKALVTAAALAAGLAFAPGQAAAQGSNQPAVIMLSAEQIRAVLAQSRRPSEMADSDTNMRGAQRMSLQDLLRQVRTAPASQMFMMTPEVLDRLWSQRSG
jgi:hypothetical protein